MNSGRCIISLTTCLAISSAFIPRSLCPDDVTYPTAVPVRKATPSISQTLTALVRPQAASTPVPVLRVVDGDTIIVLIAGQQERVRLIGVDTPESVDPRKPTECFGLEASARTNALLSGHSISLEYDESQGIRDKYGRLLAYVYRDDGLFVDEELIVEGYGFEYTYRDPYRYQREFRTAQKEAKTNQYGLWSSTTCNGKRS